MTKLAIFNLDNTLINGDSEIIWWDFLADQGVVERHAFEKFRARWLQENNNGKKFARPFIEFIPKSLALLEKTEVLEIRKQYIEEKIKPIILPKALKLLTNHRLCEDELLLMTSTNNFIAKPIADLLQIKSLIATEVEETHERYTGKIIGLPCFQTGKIQRLLSWLRTHSCSLEGGYFYSASYHDLPLLELVTHPVIVDPQPSLRTIAQARDWSIINLRT